MRVLNRLETFFHVRSLAGELSYVRRATLYVVDPSEGTLTAHG